MKSVKSKPQAARTLLSIGLMISVDSEAWSPSSYTFLFPTSWLKVFSFCLGVADNFFAIYSVLSLSFDSLFLSLFWDELIFYFPTNSSLTRKITLLQYSLYDFSSSYSFICAQTLSFCDYLIGSIFSWAWLVDSALLATFSVIWDSFISLTWDSNGNFDDS